MLILENVSGVREGQWATPRFLLIGIFCVFHLISALLGPINLMNGELLDTDSYTRLNRVLFVYEQGHWNNSIYLRSNAPFGESIHWTMPMDILLLAGGSLLSLMMPFSVGLHLWGVVISPFLHVVAFVGIMYLLRDNLDRLGIILLAIVFLIQPILVSYFMIGRPDHHSLLLAVFCWFLAGIYKWLPMSSSLRKLSCIGGIGALGLWVSVEFLVPICLFLVGSTLFWIWTGEKIASPVSRIMTAMFLISTFFLLIERGRDDLFIIEYDKISLPHFVLMGFIALIWLGVSQCGLHSKWILTRWRRLGFIGVMGILMGIVYVNLFPGFIRGPLVGMDPTIRQLVWDHVLETQPLQISEAIIGLGIGIFVLPWLGYVLWRESAMLSKFQALILFVGASIFIPLTLYEARWAPYASIILLIPYIMYVRRTLEWVESRWPNKWGEVASLLLVLLMVFWPLTVGTAMTLGESPREISTLGGGCALLPLTEYLNGQEPNAPISKTILAFKDFGPELLYRTSYNVIATPMHRNQEGLRDMLSIMSAGDQATASSIIHRRNVDRILLCLHSMEEHTVFGGSLAQDTFYKSLLKGDFPEWIREVKLPEHLQASFKLFEVIKTTGDLSP